MRVPSSRPVVATVSFASGCLAALALAGVAVGAFVAGVRMGAAATTTWGGDARANGRASEREHGTTLSVATVTTGGPEPSVAPGEARDLRPDELDASGLAETLTMLGRGQARKKELGGKDARDAAAMRRPWSLARALLEDLEDLEDEEIGEEAGEREGMANTEERADARDEGNEDEEEEEDEAESGPREQERDEERDQQDQQDHDAWASLLVADLPIDLGLGADQHEGPLTVPLGALGRGLGGGRAGRPLALWEMAHLWGSGQPPMKSIESVIRAVNTILALAHESGQDERAVIRLPRMAAAAVTTRLRRAYGLTVRLTMLEGGMVRLEARPQSPPGPPPEPPPEHTHHGQEDTPPTAP